jgi:predicted amidophosphoribosyltransferase
MSDNNNNTHCPHCGEWNEFDGNVCDECGFHFTNARVKKQVT